jgi:hypothetical protein
MDLNKALLAIRRYREQGKEVFNKSHVLRPPRYFSIGDIILLHNTRLDNDYSVKLYYY